MILTSLLAMILPVVALAQTGNTPSAQDKNFVMNALVAGLSEVQEGHLAASKSYGAVKVIGKRMVADHDKANDTLSSIAAAKGITPSAHVTSIEAA